MYGCIFDYADMTDAYFGPNTDLRDSTFVNSLLVGTEFLSPFTPTSADPYAQHQRYNPYTPGGPGFGFQSSWTVGASFGRRLASANASADDAPAPAHGEHRRDALPANYSTARDILREVLREPTAEAWHLMWDPSASGLRRARRQPQPVTTMDGIDRES